MKLDVLFNEMIEKHGNEYVLYSHDKSKKLGEFPSRKKAIKRERQINYFKHLNK